MPNLTVATAQAKGFFKEENIETEIIRMRNGVCTEALVDGDIDYRELAAYLKGMRTSN